MLDNMKIIYNELKHLSNVQIKGKKNLSRRNLKTLNKIIFDTFF